jgi:electron transfer flavoprotein alpha subunit
MNWRLGGALMASRAAVDMGWISAAHQAEQTDRTGTPAVYLVMGASGAMQHLVGISAARRVVANVQIPELPGELKRA